MKPGALRIVGGGLARFQVVLPAEVRWLVWRFDHVIRLTLEFVSLNVSFLSSDGL